MTRVDDHWIVSALEQGLMKWTLVDEPIINTDFATIAEIETVIDKRCLQLTAQRDAIKSRVDFHWWPQQPQAS